MGKKIYTTEITYGKLKPPYGETIRVKFEDGCYAYLSDKGVTLKFTKKVKEITIKPIEWTAMIKSFQKGLALLKKQKV